MRQLDIAKSLELIQRLATDLVMNRDVPKASGRRHVGLGHVASGCTVGGQQVLGGAGAPARAAAQAWKESWNVSSGFLKYEL